MNVMAPPGAVELTDAEFEAFAAIAAREAGLAIPNSKKSLVQSRVARRLRSLDMASCRDYLSLLETSPAETRELISVLTTNVSSFYREAHHFEFLRTSVFPALRPKIEAGGRVRFWSAGCSSGQEPYSIAIECLKAFPDCGDKDFLILASDIDPKILDRAIGGAYSGEELAGLAVEDRLAFFTESDPGGGQFRVGPELKKLIRFRELNLHGTWPMKNQFDVIFCRNVVIYFDDAHQKALWPRFRDQLTPEGWLFLGHSERIQDVDGSGFKTAGVTIYQRR